MAMKELKNFIGKPVFDCEDAIRRIADEHDMTVEIHDPDFNTIDIMHDERRLNVNCSAEGIIKSFTID